MNKVILLVLLMPVTALGQIMESFESGNLSDWIQCPDGRWNSDNSNPVSGIYSLHHFFDNPDAGTDRIGYSVSDLYPEKGTSKWSFSVRHGYDPSSSNNWAVFLMSDIDPVSAQKNPEISGYAVGVNQVGYDDTLRLWKVKNGIFSVVINTRINWQTGIGVNDPVKIVVERTLVGEWSLTVFRMNDTLIGSFPGKDSELFRHDWFIILYRYTSTRDRLLWLDDISIEGIFIEDKEPPAITGYEVSGSNSLLISFNEEVPDEFLVPSNFSMATVGNTVIRITRKSPVSFNLEFENPFPKKSKNRLLIKNLCDRLRNCFSNYEIEFTYFCPDRGDVIISEIMADPLPAVSLPAEEYVELLNRTSYPVKLKNWSISDGNNKYIFPPETLLPGEYMILCHAQDTLLFRKYGKTLGLKSLPAFTDDGKIIFISDSAAMLIDGIQYSSSWYGDELKDDGGWSLEIIDTDYPFSAQDNWHASLSRTGGTPGRPNSVNAENPDYFFSGIENVFAVDSNSVSIRFSEPVIDFDKKIRDIGIENSEISKIKALDPLLRAFNICLGKDLKKSTIYTIRIGEGVKDFAGNVMQKNESGFGIPESAGAGDILFNELLFNPFPGEPDFIEFYNCSRKIIDASSLFIVSVNDDLNDISSSVLVSGEKRCILPGDYYALTTDRKRVLDRFVSSVPDRIFEVPDLPSMPDDEGHLALYGRELDMIDEVIYDEEMHFPLLGDSEGISLEKIRTNGISTDKSQWHSASEISGWGTPGAPNSVLSGMPETDDRIILSSTRITPDNDGNEDFLVIDLKMNGIGNIVSVTVFDETGGFVKKLTDNLLAGPEATIVWNGTADDETLVSTGIYILLIDIYDAKGKILKWKKVCTVVN